MSFKLILKGQGDEEDEVLLDIDDKRVTRIGLRGPTGEAGAMGVPPAQTEAYLVFEFAQQNGVPTLDDLQALTHPTNLTGDDVQERQDALAVLTTSTNGTAREDQETVGEVYEEPEFVPVEDTTGGDVPDDPNPPEGSDASVDEPSFAFDESDKS